MDNQLYFRTDSDAMIVKGLLSLIERSFNGHSADENIKIDGIENKNDVCEKDMIGNGISFLSICLPPLTIKTRPL